MLQSHIRYSVSDGSLVNLETSNDFLKSRRRWLNEVRLREGRSTLATPCWPSQRFPAPTIRLPTETELQTVGQGFCFLGVWESDSRQGDQRIWSGKFYHLLNHLPQRLIVGTKIFLSTAQLFLPSLVQVVGHRTIEAVNLRFQSETLVDRHSLLSLFFGRILSWK